MPHIVSNSDLATYRALMDAGHDDQADRLLERVNNPQRAVDRLQRDVAAFEYGQALTVGLIVLLALILLFR